MEANDGTYYCVIGEVDFSKADDPVNIVPLKFPPGGCDDDYGEEMNEGEVKMLWHQIRYRVELYLETKAVVDGKALIN